MEQVRVLGLSRLDSLDLKRRFPDADISFEPAPASEQESGELVTVAVVVLTLAGIKALSAWLLRSQKGGKIKHTISTKDKDGNERTEQFEMEVNESTSEADVVKQLAGLMKVDTALLKL